MLAGEVRMVIRVGVGHSSAGMHLAGESLAMGWRWSRRVAVRVALGRHGRLTGLDIHELSLGGSDLVLQKTMCKLPSICVGPVTLRNLGLITCC